MASRFFIYAQLHHGNLNVQMYDESMEERTEWLPVPSHLDQGDINVAVAHAYLTDKTFRDITETAKRIAYTVFFEQGEESDFYDLSRVNEQWAQEQKSAFVRDLLEVARKDGREDAAKRSKPKL